MVPVTAALLLGLSCSPLFQSLADPMLLSAGTGTRFGTSDRSPVAAVLCRKQPWTLCPELSCPDREGWVMGEGAHRVLNDIIPLETAIRADVADELPHLRETVRWAARLS